MRVDPPSELAERFSAAFALGAAEEDEAAVARDRGGDLVARADGDRVAVELDPVLARAAVQDGEEAFPAAPRGEGSALDTVDADDLGVAAVVRQQRAVGGGQRAVIEDSTSPSSRGSIGRVSSTSRIASAWRAASTRVRQR